MKKLVGVPWIAEFRDPWKGNAVTDAAMAHRHQLHRSLRSRWSGRSHGRQIAL